jgi:hypothetical protein
VKRGRVATLRAFGGSMHPIIQSGQRVRLEPVDADRLELGDVVMVDVDGSTMLHLISAVDPVARRVEISGTGELNGWTSLDRVFAICTEIDGRPVPGARAKARPVRR